ncbi:MAG: ASKHA domain-containing protein [Verrucomicrobiia bacterium]
MGKEFKILILPAGKVLQIKEGESLQAVLFEEGVEFPCGGKGRCKSCRIKVLKGIWEPNGIEIKAIGERAIREGWRLACQGKVQQDIVIELQKVQDEILADDREFEFKVQEGVGVAVDLGTTTVVAQLIDLSTGALLSTTSELNCQAQFGADIISRITFALNPQNREVIQNAIRRQLWNMIKTLLMSASRSIAELKRVVIAGNTVMHHLFSGISVESLAFYPFETNNLNLQVFTAEQLGWGTAKEYEGFRVYFLPPIGSFVGSDILCGILSTGIYKAEELSLFVDLGTNGEIVLGNRERMYCASTAAGPAFEGAKISMGMRATTGAIARMRLQGSEIGYYVIGNTSARGVCGSGLVDAAAIGLQLGWLNKNGKICGDSAIKLKDSVVITQGDIRELQLAKGAISAGIHLLLEKWGASAKDVKQAFLAGAFGNYIGIESAKNIGLLPSELRNVIPAGNTALHGVKIVVCNFSEEEMNFTEIRNKITHINLKELSEFEDVFINELSFP